MKNRATAARKPDALSTATLHKLIGQRTTRGVERNRQPGGGGGGGVFGW